MLENEGASVIHVSGSMHESILQKSRKMASVQPICVPRGCFVHLAEGIKKAVKIPVIVAGRINDPTLADDIIRDKKADLISMGRALITDPEMPVKAEAGRLEEIQKCIACNRCVNRMQESLSIKCTVNASVGRERDYRIERAPVPRKVMVVGGGPAGMEAARVAALRGHHVFLYEKGSKLGGQLLLAAKPPFKEEIQPLTEYLSNQLKKMDLEIFLNTEVKGEMIDGLKPDVLILAAGSTPLLPSFPGVNLDHVLTAHRILKEGTRLLTGKGRVIIVGGGMVGCETAEFILEEGRSPRRIVVVEMLGEIASDVEPAEREFLIQRFEEKGIEFLLNTKANEVTEEGVIAVDREGQRHLIKGDAVILAIGAKPEQDLKKCLDEKGMNFFMIGDCSSPRRIFDAIHEAAHVARQI